MNIVWNIENTGGLCAVLKGKKSILTRELESGIFRIHIHYSISAKKGKQQNISKLKYCTGVFVLHIPDSLKFEIARLQSSTQLNNAFLLYAFSYLQ